MIHKSAFSGLTNKEKHASENGQAQGRDGERVKNKQTKKTQPISKENLWKTFRKSGELFLLLKQGVAQHFCIVLHSKDIHFEVGQYNQK